MKKLKKDKLNVICERCKKVLTKKELKKYIKKGMTLPMGQTECCKAEAFFENLK